MLQRRRELRLHRQLVDLLHRFGVVAISNEFDQHAMTSRDPELAPDQIHRMLLVDTCGERRKKDPGTCLPFVPLVKHVSQNKFGQSCDRTFELAGQGTVLRKLMFFIASSTKLGE